MFRCWESDKLPFRIKDIGGSVLFLFGVSAIGELFEDRVSACRRSVDDFIQCGLDGGKSEAASIGIDEHDFAGAFVENEVRVKDRCPSFTEEPLCSNLRVIGAAQFDGQASSGEGEVGILNHEVPAPEVGKCLPSAADGVFSVSPEGLDAGTFYRGGRGFFISGLVCRGLIIACAEAEDP